MRSNLDKKITTIKPVMDILSINTDTDNMVGVKTAQAYYMELAEKMGFEAVLCAEDKNGDKRVVEIRPKGHTGEKAKLGLVVHLDTVPIGEDWTHNPYGEIDETGRVYGRGVIDDKAPAIEVLQAMYLLKDTVGEDWTIICGSSEEAEWVDMEAYLREKRAKGEELPDFSITVDGDGVQNGCRGYLDLKLVFDKLGENHLISSFGTPEDAANNSVPGFASAVVDGELIEARGKACHSSIPQNGINAIIELAKKLKEEKPEAYLEYENFFKLMEKMGTSFDAADTLFFEEKPSEMNGQDVGYTSACPTTSRLNDGKMEVNLNIRLMAGTTREEVDKAIKEICETYRCRAEIGELELPAFIPVDNPSIKNLLEAYEEELGKATQSEIARGVGYNAALPRCAIFGPRWAVEHDEEDTCHAANESRTIKDIVTFMNMFARFVRKEIPLPEIDKVNETLLTIQSSSESRELIRRNFREYTPMEISMMTEMFLNEEYNPPEGKLEEEKIVINGMRELNEAEIYSDLTPEQLSFIVCETIISHKLCGTNLTLEQFTKATPAIPLIMARYGTEDIKAQGLLKEGRIDDKAFLSLLREKIYTSEMIEQVVESFENGRNQIVTEDTYSR